MIARLAAVAAAHARMLARRPTAVALLALLPLAFYGALYRHSSHAVTVGGAASAFSADGAAIFSMLPARAADQRLTLTGYQTAVLIGGRLIVLEAASILISPVTSAVMIAGTGPAHPAYAVAGVILTGVAAVPLGLALGALLPRELEAVLIPIGIVGIQITARLDGVISPLLPFHGASQLLDAAVGAPRVLAAAGPYRGLQRRPAYHRPGRVAAPSRRAQIIGRSRGRPQTIGHV